MQNIHFSSNSNEWTTPKKLFNFLDSTYNFTLDPAATKENALCKKYYTKEQDGLLQSWKNEIVFCNPPYGREISQWVEKAHNESQHAKIVLLIPARTDTIYWHNFIFPHASKIYFLKGRLKFGEGSNSAPFPSAIVEFGNSGEEQIIAAMKW